MPMTMELICWDRLLTLPVNCLAMLRNGTTMEMLTGRPDREKFGALVMSRVPPTMAVST